MYIPPYYKIEEKEKLVSFIKENSFGLLITNGEEKPFATHLPFLLEERENELFLISHLSAANPHGNQLEKNQLIVFTGPHSYISPKNYEKELNVPTWNYTAVHVTGPGKLLKDPADAGNILERTIQFYESGYFDQWKNLPEDYKVKMIRGITAFEINVSGIEGKFKLSQNKTGKEIKNIITDLKGSGNPTNEALGEFMENHYKGSDRLL